MSGYIVKRILATLPVMTVVAIFVFHPTGLLDYFLPKPFCRANRAGHQPGGGWLTRYL